MTVIDRTEAAEYFFTYINQVPEGEIGRILETQEREVVQLLSGISDERSLHRYAPGKWTIREVVSHINDTERMFTFRALWFARGFDSELPSFEQDVAIRTAGANDRSYRGHVDEFRAIRAATGTSRHLTMPTAFMVAPRSASDLAMNLAKSSGGA